MSEEFKGPIMLCATSVLKQGPARIGSITKEIKLPRTILLKTLVSMIIYGFLGLFVGILIGGIKAIMYSTIIGIAGAYIATTYSPLKGESLSRFLGLSLKASRERTMYEGKFVKLYVGVTPIYRKAAGNVILWKKALDVAPLNYDERGVLIKKDKFAMKFIQEEVDG